MKKSTVALVILAVIALIIVYFTSRIKTVGEIDFDCDDFATQEQAQKMYEWSIREYGKDKYQLDGKGKHANGKACENLLKKGLQGVLL